MADLFTHVLVPYIVLLPISWRLSQVDRRLIPVAMGGAAIPDLTKVSIILDARTVDSIIGYSFSYQAISSLGGVILLSGSIALLFARHRRFVFSFLLFGGVTALLLDGLRAFADGYANPWLYPLVYARIPTPSLYVTSDMAVPVLTVFIAGVVYLLDRYRPWKARSRQ